jgi:hypothetical protein
MVIAGIKKRRIQGASSKNLSRVAYPKSKILLSFKTNRNRPFTNKNNMMVIYPVRLLKNWWSSFLAMENMPQFSSGKNNNRFYKQGTCSISVKEIVNSTD